MTVVNLQTGEIVEGELVEDDHDLTAAEARMVRLDRDQRREIVAEMRDAGMGLNPIGSALGVSAETARQDLQVLEGRGREFPSRITTLDGRNHAAKWAPEVLEQSVTESQPARATRRKPLTDFARDTAYDLFKLAERLERITEDDRFDSNRDAIQRIAGGQFRNAIALINEFDAALNSKTAPTPEKATPSHNNKEIVP